MRKALILIVLLALAGFGAWSYFGGLDAVTEKSVETALVESGAPPDLAACMAGRMVERLSIAQLRELQNIRAQDGESAIPRSTAELLNRVRRVDDPEAVEVTVRAAAACSFGLPI